MTLVTTSVRATLSRAAVGWVTLFAFTFVSVFGATSRLGRPHDDGAARTWVVGAVVQHSLAHAGELKASKLSKAHLVRGVVERKAERLDAGDDGWSALPDPASSGPFVAAQPGATVRGQDEPGRRLQLLATGQHRSRAPPGSG